MTNKKQKPEADNPRRTIGVGSGDMLDHIVKQLEREEHWSMAKGGCGVHVMMDSETCFICNDMLSAMKKVIAACQARSLGAKKAIRSLSQQNHDEQP
jgi:hypothetical protein